MEPDCITRYNVTVLADGVLVGDQGDQDCRIGHLVRGLAANPPSAQSLRPLASVVAVGYGCVAI